jgi:hypothetical protein
MNTGSACRRLWIGYGLWLSVCGWLGCSLVWCQEVPLPASSSIPGQPSWELGPTGSRVSLRGLVAASDRDIWVCGSEATVLRSTDGGSGWTECGPAQFPGLEFRSIHAWNAHTACIASSGTPAVILKTEDGGAHWREVFRHASGTAFFNGMKFWDGTHGIVFGDPVDGRWCILESTDGGEHWRSPEPHTLPVGLPHEAGFAASNSAMCIGHGGSVWIGTGGTTAQASRVLMRERWSDLWTSALSPLVSSQTEGIFSIGHSDELRTAMEIQLGQTAGASTPARPLLMVAVGGDYRDDQASQNTAAYSEDRGQTWNLAALAPASFCSAVICVEPDELEAGKQLWIATGPKASYSSSDARHWHKFSDSGFHTLTRSATTVFAAGANGRFAKLVW